MKKYLHISPNIFERIRKYKTKSTTPFLTARNPHSFTKYNSFQKSYLSIHKTHSQIFPRLNEMNIIHYNITKHNSNINTHNNHIIKWIMFDDKRRIVSIFKNYLLWDETAEFLRRYYLFKESIGRLPKIANYYETYTIFSPNYFGINYEQVKLMMKWVKKKRQLLDETAKEEHQINYNYRNGNNDNVIIPPEEIESIKNETPLKKDRTNNEFLSELSKSRFKDIKNENNDQTICSLMKDISSIHSFGHYEKQTQKINKTSKQKKQVDLKGKSTTNKLSKRTVHLVQSQPLSKTKIIITNKALINNTNSNNNIAKVNINSHRASVLALPSSYALMTESQLSKQVKRFPLLKEQLPRKTSILKKTAMMKKKLILKQNEITPEIQINMNVKHVNNLHNNLRSNSVTKENKSMTRHFRNTNYNTNNIYLNTQPEEVKYPYLITERSRSKTKGMSESSKEILFKTHHKQMKKVPFVQIYPKKQRINNEQEMIRKVLLRKKNVDV